MINRKPKALFVGPEAVGQAIQGLRKEWDFISEVLPNGALRPIQDLNQLQQGFAADTISRDAEVIIINDTLFDPNDPTELFENAVASFAPYSLTAIVSYRPEYKDIIMQKVQSKQAQIQEDGHFYFIDPQSPNPSIDAAVNLFIKESSLRSVSEVLLGRPLDARIEDEITVQDPGSISIYDEDTLGKGEVIAVTSNKGGSGKTTVALSLATFLGHASINSVKEGLEEKPLKVIIVDFDVRDGQVGFITGNTSPTMLELIKAQPLTEEAVDSVIIHNERLKVDVMLAPKLPAYADEFSLTFYKDLLKLLRHKYDYIIVDTSVNYLDPLLDQVTYPDSDAIIFVCDYVIQAILGMSRFIISIERSNPNKDPEDYIDPDKMGIVVNKTLQNTDLDKNLLLKATQGVPILTSIPANPKIAGHASNNQSIDLLMKHPDFTSRFHRLASQILGDSYQISRNVN